MIVRIPAKDIEQHAPEELFEFWRLRQYSRSHFVSQCIFVEMTWRLPLSMKLSRIIVSFDNNTHNLFHHTNKFFDFYRL